MSWKMLGHTIGALALNGAVTALSAVLVDPQHFDIFTLAGVTAAAKVAVGGALLSVVMYLKRSPLSVPTE